MKTNEAFLLEKLFLINTSLQKAKSQQDCVPYMRNSSWQMQYKYIYYLLAT